jgi:cell division protein YceG involved in septum cleavage
MQLHRLRNPDNAKIICERLAEGWSLRQIGKELDCSASSIVQWRAEDATFSEQYARAMDARADRMADEILEIADEGSNDWMEREGVLVPNHEHISRSKLRADTRRWLMAKMAPKRYGEKTTTELTGADGTPLMPVLNVVLSDKASS